MKKLSDSISVLPARYRKSLEFGASAEDCADVLSEYILEIETMNIMLKNELSYLYGQELVPSKYKENISKVLKDYYK